MSADQRSPLVRILSRWRREATPRVLPASCDEIDELEELQGQLVAGSAGSARRTYSGALNAGQKWKKKVTRATTREQMGHAVIELTAWEPAGAQLMPIHEVGQLIVCEVCSAAEQKASAYSQSPPLSLDHYSAHHQALHRLRKFMQISGCSCSCLLVNRSILNV